MSNSRKYYYVVSSLPELKFASKLPFTVQEFISEYSNELIAEKKLIDVLLLKNDIRNLKLYFENDLNKKTFTQPSIYNLEELKEIILIKENVPEFISEFLDKYESNEEYLDNFNELEQTYLVYGAAVENTFLHTYFQFELNFRNVISALRSRKKDIDVIKYSVGDEDAIIVSRIKNNKSLPDFAIGGEVVWIDKLIQIFDKDEPLNLEESLDKIRFEQINSMIDLLDFQTEKILAFIVQLSILERWNKFDKEKGRKYTYDIVKI